MTLHRGLKCNEPGSSRRCCWESGNVSPCKVATGLKCLLLPTRAGVLCVKWPASSTKCYGKAFQPLAVSARQKALGWRQHYAQLLGWVSSCLLFVFQQVGHPGVAYLSQCCSAAMGLLEEQLLCTQVSIWAECGMLCSSSYGSRRVSLSQELQHPAADLYCADVVVSCWEESVGRGPGEQYQTSNPQGLCKQ